MTETAKHFLDLNTVSKESLRLMLSNASALKLGEVGLDQPLSNKSLAMVFEKPSTRTRVSFEVGMKQLGGHVVVLNSSDLQVARGESIADTARVLSKYVDCIMMRTFERDKILEMSKFSTVPVINGLTDSSHPCQLMADIMTFEEHRGPIRGKTVAWSGDGNNMASSWIHACVKFDFKLNIACPEERSPNPSLIVWAKENGGNISLFHEPVSAVRNADCVVTDTWVSMGEDSSNPHNTLSPFQVNKELMEKASPNAVFLHCLPAHRGEEVTSDVIDGPKSVVWDEAENRLHTQKAILLWCMT
ncbi:MAG: ornithine carbamoyltransferase [Rhodospirillaceae bacterium]|nr:ornithine carbamoyltransferase [Rhodospirillaceae bacterium]|tara:strand:+ start:1753 stop:2658 length:906 start_codon:yes stop_codon:yes gene_type:complete